MCGRNPAKVVSILTSQLLSLWTRYCGVTTWTVRRLFEDVQIVVFVFQLFVLHFFTWVSSPQSVSLSSFLNVWGGTISNKLFCRDMNRVTKLQRKGHAMMITKTFGYCLPDPGMHFGKKLCVLFIFCAYMIHTSMLMGLMGTFSISISQGQYKGLGSKW